MSAVMKEVATDSSRYERCLANSRKVNWDIEKDVIRNRTFDASVKFLPDSLSLVNQLEFLNTEEQRFLSQIQGRSYAYIFGLVERFINAKVLELGSQHALGDQVALEAMVQFSKEELKHQALFRRIEDLIEAVLPGGYQMAADPDQVAEVVLARSSWSVLALTMHIEVFTQVHYKESIDDQDEISPLFKDVFKYHWMEEAQHATLDELEWDRLHATLSPQAIDEGVDDLIDLVVAVDGILQAQSELDTGYFFRHSETKLTEEEVQRVKVGMLKAYRWQYIVSGVQLERFMKALSSKVTEKQMQRIVTALTPLIEFVEQ